MGYKQPDEAAIFNVARKIAEPESRAGYLKQACGENPALLERVGALLRAHDEEKSFLESPPSVFIATADTSTIREGPGTVIGPYKLHEQIGEGGFGVVYLAEQQKPVRRRVALKIIKPGMDSKEVIARFEAERQALALMDHANIARVLDAGATESGRPYFVMELVKGIPITDYCDQCNLPTRERLGLFVSVCHAIQHAHTKGIIHRDVKPTNVMMAMQNEEATPKVIDFGVAKAINQRLTEHTLYTRFAQMVGTPMYMSPEQAEMSPIEVDTRTDIYSLGVLLYELLVGATPFDSRRLSEASYEKLRRIIREEEPPPPSSRLSTLGDMAATIAEHRRTDLHKLNRLVRGDLDCIVMKALEKDRMRRYETANALARDIERFLAEEPVEARPPSAIYRFGKFARRNRAALITAAVVLITVVAGLTVSTILIAREQGRTAEALTDAQENLKTADEQRQRAETNFRKAREAVDKMLVQVADELRTLPGLREQPDSPEIEKIKQALLEDALEFCQGFLEEQSTDPLVRYETGHAYLRVAQITQAMYQYERSEETYRGAISLLEELAAEFPDEPRYRGDLASAWRGVGAIYGDSGRLEQWVRAYEQSVTLLELLVTEFPSEAGYKASLAWSYDALDGSLLWFFGEFQAAKEAARRALKLWEELADQSPEEHLIGLALFQGNLGDILTHGGWLRDAEKAYRQALTIFEKLSAKSPARIDYKLHGLLLSGLGDVLYAMDRFEEAEKAYLQALTVLESMVAEGSVGDDRFYLAMAQRELGVLMARTDRPIDAKEYYRQSISVFDELIGDLPHHRASLINRGWCYWFLGHLDASEDRLPEAEQSYREAVASFEMLSSPAGVLTHRGLVCAEERLVDALVKTGRIDEAEQICRQTVGRYDELKSELLTEARQESVPQLYSYDDPQWTGAVAARRGQGTLHLIFIRYLAAAYCNLADVLIRDGRTEEALAEYSKAIEASTELGTDHADVWRHRGGIYVELEQWDLATGDLAKAIELGHAGYRPHYELALVSLVQGDLEAFRSACSSLLKQFAEAEDTTTAHFVVWTCVLAPEAAADLSRPITLAERAVEADPESSRHLTTLGAILYRAGRFEEALKRLTQAARLLDLSAARSSSAHSDYFLKSLERIAFVDRLLELPAARQSSPASTSYFLAMAHHGMGDTDEANQWFNRAAEWTNKVIAEHDHGQFRLPWNRRLTLRLLHQEAGALLGIQE